MPPKSITPVLLCGGSGTRLWPLSRKSYPKQFAPLLGQETLFQASARRLSGQANGLSFAAPLVRLWTGGQPPPVQHKTRPIFLPNTHQTDSIKGKSMVR